MSINCKKQIKIISICLSIIILFLLIFGLLYNKLDFFDKTIYELIIKYKSNNLTSVFKFITFFASILWFIIFIVVLLAINHTNKNSLIIVIYLIGATLLIFLLKNIFVRDRPYELMIIEETGYSFPSGHSFVSMAFYGLIGYFTYKSKLSRKHKIIILSLLLLLILLIGISRIYLGVHYPSDVLAGFMVGIIYLIGFISLVNINERKYKK